MALHLLPVNFLDEVDDLAVTPSAVATLPVTNLQSNIRDRVWRSPNVNQQVITGTWGGNVRRISAWGVWPADGSSLIGSKWRLQLYSDVAKATQVYDSGTLDFFTFTGAPWGNDPWGAFRWGAEDSDRLARLAPMVRYFTAANVSAFTITVTDGGAVDTPYFEARRLWLADYVRAPYNAKFGVEPAWVSGSKHQRTVGSTLRRLARGRWRELRFETYLKTEADRAAWSDLQYVCDPAIEIVASLYPANATARLERDFTVMGSLEVLSPMVFEDVNCHRLKLALVES